MSATGFIGQNQQQLVFPGGCLFKIDKKSVPPEKDRPTYPFIAWSCFHMIGCYEQMATCADALVVEW